MFLMALDTCFASCSTAVFDPAEQRVVAHARAFMERGHAEAIAPMVQSVMAEAGAGFDDLKAIAVTIGPGTFTGVRIGLALAQGMAVANNTAMIGVSSLLATAAPVFPILSREQTVLVCHAAGASGFVYVQRFDASGAALADIALARPSEVDVTVFDVVVGSAADLLSSTARRTPEFDLPDAKAFVAFAATQPASSTVQPIYIRDVDAKPQLLAIRPLGDIHVARVGNNHAPLLAALHDRSHPPGWSTLDVEHMIATPGTVALLAQTNTTPVGFMIVRAAADEAEILMLAVDPAFRRRGVAQRLVTSAVAHVRALKTRELFLEVAQDNDAALALYHKSGFVTRGVRKDYYKRDGGTIDAIVMRLDL